MNSLQISGFSYVRNGFDYGVPFLESILSALEICDEYIIAVGDSSDGTRESILKLNNPKIKIVDTLWDESQNQYGKIFAQQTNIALDHVKGNWLIHLQADEVLHQDDINCIVNAIKNNDSDEKVQGFILPFLHFYGGYNYIRTSRTVHKHEVRIMRNISGLRSYRDSQGFRIYSSIDNYNLGKEKGRKLWVKKIDIPVYHYTEVRNPEKSRKRNMIDYYFTEEFKDGLPPKLNRRTRYDRLELFKGTHPHVMQQKVDEQDWEFTFDPKNAHWKLKDRIMTPIEDFLGIRIGEYKNYKLIK